MRFDYYWRHNCNNASEKFKQTGYEIESRGYLLFFWRSLYPLRHVPKALGAWDMGEPKNVGGGKAKPLGEPPLGADGSKGAWYWALMAREASQRATDTKRPSGAGGGCRLTLCQAVASKGARWWWVRFLFPDRREERNRTHHRHAT